MSVSRHVNLGLLQLQILWFLSREESCGYSLMRKLNEVKRTTVSAGVLYPALSRLSSQGFIKVSKTGARGKKFYALTAKGRRELKHNCEEFLKTFAGLINEYKCSCCGARK